MVTRLTGRVFGAEPQGRTLEPLELPVELSAHRARKGELAPLESLVACLEYGLEVRKEGLGGVVVVQRTQSLTVACTDTAAATARATLTGVVAIFAKQTDGTEGSKRIVQVE